PAPAAASSPLSLPDALPISGLALLRGLRDMALIMGIDPGSRLTGYGIINAVNNRLEYVACGSIRLPAVEHPQRLKLIFDGISQRSEEHTSELQSRENLVCRL